MGKDLQPFFLKSNGNDWMRENGARMDIHKVCAGVWTIVIEFPFRVEYDAVGSDEDGTIELWFSRERDNDTLMMRVLLEKLHKDCLVTGQINKKTWWGTAYRQKVYERILTKGKYFYTTRENDDPWLWESGKVQ